MVKREKKPDICKIGTAAMVFRGEALQTAGGLKKDDLMMNPKGRIVSIRRSRIAMANYDDKKARLAERAAETRAERAAIAPKPRAARARRVRPVAPPDVDAEAFADRIMAAHAEAVRTALAPKPRAARARRVRPVAPPDVDAEAFADRFSNTNDAIIRYARIIGKKADLERNINYFVEKRSRSLNKLIEDLHREGVIDLDEIERRKAALDAKLDAEVAAAVAHASL